MSGKVTDTMCLQVFVYISALFGVVPYINCLPSITGEYIITHAPQHVDFKSDAGQIQTSEIPHVISSTFGFSLDNDLKWSGLGQGSLFKRPKANVVVSVSGVEGGLDVKHHAKYTTQVDDPVVNTESVVNNMVRRVADNPLLVDFSVDMSVFSVLSEHPMLFKNLPGTFDRVRLVIQNGESGFYPAQMASLNTTKEEDLLFLGELHIINKIVEALKTRPESVTDNVPDFYHFQVSGLEKLIQAYGANSQQVQDAKVLLQQVIDRLTSDMRELYGDNIVIQVVTVPRMTGVPVRKVRSLKAEATAGGQSLEDQINKASVYNDDFPIIFNIILWGSILLILTIFGVSYGMWYMDPGSDSVIYRMTNPRMKKD